MMADVREARAPTLADIQAARARIADSVMRTPLVRLNVDEAEIYLKLENLQPIGSFKLRGAGNAIACATPDQLADGVLTASAGNMAQGVAWHARRLGIPCTVVVPDHAPATKLDAITRLGGTFIKVPFAEWWQVLMTRQFPGASGFFIHPVSDHAVMAGNGTIGLEILEDLPDVDEILIPYGGGGLSCGIAAAVRALRPSTALLACEVETSAAFSAALAAGAITKIDYRPSFVDGIGSASVLPEMWPLARRLLNGSRVVTLAQVAEAIGVLAGRSRIIAEGAGAAPVAAALAARRNGTSHHWKTVCVVSGGNIDLTRLVELLDTRRPS
ncbi:MAG: pyridoxal-phosphate dependent enzyme [Gemmatimonadaceae bacterium]|jgi:threonine dehydratase|nr:pyridoxal-phosphate dependent enzyme [Gemmatimonadaceae bacterium]